MASTKQSLKPIITPPEPHNAWDFDQTYYFRLRRIKGGSFHGLWELSILDKGGKLLKTISDADALNFCMENLQGELENDGF